MKLEFDSTDEAISVFLLLVLVLAIIASHLR